VNSRIRVQSLDAPEDSCQAEFQGFLHTVTFSPDGTRLVACGTAGRQRESKKQIWGVMEVRDARTLKILREEGFEEDVFEAHFHDGGKLCTFLTIHAYRSAGSRVVFRQFDTATWKELGNGRRSTAFGAVSPDGKLGMTRETGNEPGVGKTDEAVLWDLTQLAKEAMPEKKRLTLGVSYPSWDLLQAFSPDGSRLAVVGIAWQIELWDHVKGRRLGSSKMTSGKLSSLVFSPDGSLLATIEDEKRVAVWRTDGEGLKAHREPWTFPGTIRALTFDPSSHFLALATANGTVYLLRVRDAAP
jgi:WD40 repeat protein